MLGHDPIIQNHDDAAIALRPDQATAPWRSLAAEF
jgi:hypothetical protein